MRQDFAASFESFKEGIKYENTIFGIFTDYDYLSVESVGCVEGKKIKILL